MSVSFEGKALHGQTCNTYERINTIAFHPVPSLLFKNKSLRKIKGVPDGYIVVVVVVIVIVVVVVSSSLVVWEITFHRCQLFLADRYSKFIKDFSDSQQASFAS